MKRVFVALIALSLLTSCDKVTCENCEDEYQSDNIEDEQVESAGDAVLKKIDKFIEKTDLSLLGPKEKTDDMDTLYANVEKLSEQDQRAEFLLDNWDSLEDQEKYLVGNDPDGLEFVYNYETGNTDFEYFLGESKNYGRLTPYYSQWDNRWGYEPLYTGNIGFSGCGPTSMAMILSRLKSDESITPLEVSKDAEGYMTEEGISWNFFGYEAQNYGLSIKDIPLDENEMKLALEDGPLLVSVDRGYFTIFGHILVIDSYNNGKFVINDPNSYTNSEMKWDFDEISDQIVRIWKIY